MGRHNLLSFFVVALALVSLTAVPLSRAADSRCGQIRRTLKQKKHLVSEYMKALQTSYDRKDLQIAELLNYKINELKAQIGEMERNLAGCSDSRTSNPAEGMESTKSDQGIHSDKNCQELRKILFSLVREIHALNKRKRSLLSNLSEKEELQLLEATEKRKTLEHILSTRCSERRSRRGLLRRLRR